MLIMFNTTANVSSVHSLGGCCDGQLSITNFTHFAITSEGSYSEQWPVLIDVERATLKVGGSIPWLRAPYCAVRGHAVGRIGRTGRAILSALDCGYSVSSCFKFLS